MLRLNKVSRSDMGHYMCMAQNGVPPAVSKRIAVNVHFAPVIVVPNQLVGAPLNTDVTLACHVEASPKAIIYWMRDSNALLGDNMVVSSEKYETKVSSRSLFESRMTLTVRDFSRPDVGTYRCVAKNSLGEVERSIRLYEIPGVIRRPVIPAREDDEDEEGGSAEAETEPPPKRQEHSLPAPTAASGAEWLVPGGGFVFYLVVINFL
ncbi:lachesin [Halyomorpha halys]|uniref:lachesin n=1 Tax=Halyomorpha halys TaxID=286706 RepID=UPI0006D4CE3A|nr:lachesin-like [Halyomorpha halys]